MTVRTHHITLVNFFHDFFVCCVLTNHCGNVCNLVYIFPVIKVHHKVWIVLSTIRTWSFLFDTLHYVATLSASIRAVEVGIVFVPSRPFSGCGFLFLFVFVWHGSSSYGSI
jgi:hypothetical protein